MTEHETLRQASARKRLFRRHSDQRVTEAIDTLTTLAEEVTNLRRELTKERKRRAEIWRERNEMAARMAELEES